MFERYIETDEYLRLLMSEGRYFVNLQSNVADVKGTKNLSYFKFLNIITAPCNSNITSKLL